MVQARCRAFRRREVVFPSVGLFYGSSLVRYGRVSVGQAALGCQQGAFPSVVLIYSVALWCHMGAFPSVVWTRFRWLGYSTVGSSMEPYGRVSVGQAA